MKLVRARHTQSMEINLKSSDSEIEFDFKNRGEIENGDSTNEEGLDSDGESEDYHDENDGLYQMKKVNKCLLNRLNLIINIYLFD